MERLGLNVLLGREEAQVEAGPGTRSGCSGYWHAGPCCSGKGQRSHINRLEAEAFSSLFEHSRGEALPTAA